jgi:hypothetical protein
MAPVVLPEQIWQRGAPKAPLSRRGVGRSGLAAVSPGGDRGSHKKIGINPMHRGQDSGNCRGLFPGASNHSGEWSMVWRTKRPRPQEARTTPHARRAMPSVRRLTAILAADVTGLAWRGTCRRAAAENFFDLYVQNVHRHGRFFVIDVHNRHQSKIASNCYAYLEKATKVDTNEEIQFRTCELKWSGYVLPNAHILPGGVRGFDAFWVPHDAPDQLVFQVFTDRNI